MASPSIPRMQLKQWVMIAGACAAVVLSMSCAKQRVTHSKGDGASGDIAACDQLTAKHKYEKAIECLQIYKSRYAGTPQAAQAELTIGDNLFQQKEFLMSAEAYEDFLRNHPLDARADYAFYRMGAAYFAAAPKAIDRDQEHLDEAVKAFETQLQLFPQSKYHEATQSALRSARIRLGKRHYYIGNFYYRTGEYLAAIPRLSTAISEYPEIPELPRAAYQLARAYLKMNDADDARRVYSAMESQLPKNPWTVKTEHLLRSRHDHGN